MYKVIKNLNDMAVNVFTVIGDMAKSIPFDPANTDYARFKREIEAGTAELQDANGNVLSAADANAFVATLP